MQGILITSCTAQWATILKESGHLLMQLILVPACGCPCCAHTPGGDKRTATVLPVLTLSLPHPQDNRHQYVHVPRHPFHGPQQASQRQEPQQEARQPKTHHKALKLYLLAFLLLGTVLCLDGLCTLELQTLQTCTVHSGASLASVEVSLTILKTGEGHTLQTCTDTQG